VGKLLGNATGFDDGCELEIWVGASEGGLQVDPKEVQMFVVFLNTPLHSFDGATLPQPLLPAEMIVDSE